MRFVLFTDDRADLAVTRASESAKAAGFDGLDLTLHPGGHVRPEDAEVGLAEARRAVEDSGVALPMVRPAATDVESPHAEDGFAAAAHYDTRLVKLGYREYLPFGTLAAQIEQAREKLRRVVRLGRKYNGLPCVHCRSGRLLASEGPLTYLILRGFKPGEVGAYVDPVHMTIEGGRAVWEMGLDLLAPWLALVGVENFRWLPAERDGRGQSRWR